MKLSSLPIRQGHIHWIKYLGLSNQKCVDSVVSYFNVQFQELSASLDLCLAILVNIQNTGAS